MRGACGLHGRERMWDRRMGGKISNWRKDDGGKQSKMGSGGDEEKHVCCSEGAMMVGSS